MFDWVLNKPLPSAEHMKTLKQKGISLECKSTHFRGYGNIYSLWNMLRKLFNSAQFFGKNDRKLYRCSRKCLTGPKHDSVRNYLGKCRSSHRRCSSKKGVLKNIANFTGKHPRQSLFFNKAAGLSLQLYQKRNSDTGVFLWILRNS